MKDDRYIHNQMDYTSSEHSVYRDKACGAGRSDGGEAAGRTARVLFWSFPDSKGKVQPWRRRLWELQKNSDPE